MLFTFTQCHYFNFFIGWQPGVQEGAMDWDEDWDKFEDEGNSIFHILVCIHFGMYLME